MSTAPAFGTQIIGQTEKALNAILDRQLAGTGLTEPQWVTLTIAVMSGGSLDVPALATRVATALKIGGPDARARIEELAAANLLEVRDDDRATARVTHAGNELHGRVRRAVSEITQRLWGDLSADDLAIAGRVLATVLERANGELARA